MAKKSELALALAGVVLCAGVVWFALSPTDAPARAADATIESPARSTSPADTLVDSADSALAPVRTLDVAGTNDAARAQVESAPPFDAQGAIWVEGRVVFPPDTPADERAEVLAYTEDYYSDDAKPHRGRVAANGTFRVAFPLGTESGWLGLRARYSYLYEAVALTFDEPPAPLVLEPELGGCIHATFVLPAGGEGRASELVDTKISAYATNRVRFNGETANFTRTIEVEEPPSVEIGGLVPGVVYQVTGSPESFAPFKIRGQSVRAGLVSSLEIPLLNGVRFNGQVVDEHDQPIAGATFRSVVSNGNAATYADRDTPTGPDGRFALRGLCPGRITLTASAPGYLATRLVTESALDGSSHDDVRFVLRTGRSIRGRVAWRDGRAASGASIGIALLSSGDSSKQSEALGWDWEEKEFTADAEGAFEITGLTEGPFALIARAAAVDAPAIAKDEKSRASVRLDKVMSGEERLELTLDAGAELRGRVVDDTGNAVPKFTIEATPASTNPDWTEIADSLRGKMLGGDGHFVVPALRAGNWRITAHGNGASVSREALVPASDAAFEIMLPRPASVSGVVLDPEARPVRGARVSYSLASSSGSPDEVLATSKPTGIDGRFAFEMVSSGPAVLIARQSDWAPSEVVRVDLAPGGSRSDVVVILRPSGRVTGEILGVDGRPDPMRSVYMHGIRYTDGLSVYDESDASGLFAFDGLPAGEYWLQTQASLVERENVRGADGQSDWQALQNFTRRASATVVAGETTHVVLGERPRAPVRVFGRVTQNGRAVEGINVSATRSDAKGGMRDTKTARTGVDGRYELALNEPGNYWFQVSRQSRGTSCQRQEAIPEQEQVAVDFELPDGRIAGRVLSPEGDPLPELQVQLSCKSATAMTPGVLRSQFGHATTDADGRFAFEYLLPGTYSVRAGERLYWSNDQAPRYGPASADELVLAEHATIDNLELKLELAATLEVETVGPTGDPVAGAEVFTFEESGARVDDVSGVVTDAAGHKRVGGLPSRALLVFVRKGSLASSISGPVRVRAGESRQIKIDLRAATLLDIVLTRGDEATNAPVCVRDEHGIDYAALWSRNTAAAPRASTTIAGQQIGPLPPGRYRVSPRDAELEMHGVDVVVAGDDVQKVRITVPK